MVGGLMARAPDPRITLLDQAELVPGMALRSEVADAYAHKWDARRYIFDQHASKRVGEMMRDNLDLMVDNIEFARTPYPTTYLELDCHALWEGWRPDQGDENIVKTRDLRAGFLIHNGTCIVLAKGPQYESRGKWVPESALCMLCFRINRPQSMPMDKLVGLRIERADLVKQAYIFGGQRTVGDRDIDAFSSRTFPEHVDVNLPALPPGWSHSQIAAHFDVRPAYHHKGPEEILEMFFLGGGDPLTVATMLLLLNQPSRYIGLAKIEGKRGIYKGKLKSFKEHHVVTVHLDPEAKVRRIFEHTDRASPIAHPVEGHWKHYNKAPWCNHHFDHGPHEGQQAWEPVGTDKTESGDYKRYWCSICLQRRTWTEHFTRGDAERGFATHEYAVTR